MKEIHLALIYGSARQGRLCDKVARWAGAQIANRSEFALEVIDPTTLVQQSAWLDEGSAGLTTLRQRVARADAFVVVTPEYNHGYPAELKLLIDSVRDPWQAKPVAFVSYGGFSGGLRAVEQLRQVFAALEAVPIRDGVSFVQARGQFDAGGELLHPGPARQAMAQMLARLHWWAQALREAREALPYARAVA